MCLSSTRFWVSWVYFPILIQFEVWVPILLIHVLPFIPWLDWVMFIISWTSHLAPNYSVLFSSFLWYTLDTFNRTASLVVAASWLCIMEWLLEVILVQPTQKVLFVDIQWKCYMPISGGRLFVPLYHLNMLHPLGSSFELRSLRSIIQPPMLRGWRMHSAR